MESQASFGAKTKAKNYSIESGPRSERVATDGKRELKLFWIPIPDDDETHLLPFLKEACEWLDSKMAGDFFIHTARWAISSDTLGWIGLDFWLLH